MLGGDAEQMLSGCFPGIFFFDQIGLIDHLSGIPQEFLAIGGQDHTFVGALENGNAKFLLQFVDSRGQAGLCNEKGTGGFADGTAFCDTNDLF